MCGCNQLSSFNGDSQNQFGLGIPIRVEHSNFWPFSSKATANNTPSADAKTETTKKTDSSDTTKNKTSTGEKVKGAINDGTVKNTSEAASSWLDTISKGINIFSGKTPVNTSNSASSSNSTSSENDNENNTGIPSYVWWIVGGLALLGAIWAGIHFSKQT